MCKSNFQFSALQYVERKAVVPQQRTAVIRLYSSSTALHCIAPQVQYRVPRCLPVFKYSLSYSPRHSFQAFSVSSVAGEGCWSKVDLTSATLVSCVVCKERECVCQSAAWSGSGHTAGMWGQAHGSSVLIQEYVSGSAPLAVSGSAPLIYPPPHQIEFSRAFAGSSFAWAATRFRVRPGNVVPYHGYRLASTPRLKNTCRAEVVHG